jgi:DNA polymerase-3 subunit epsilon
MTFFRWFRNEPWRESTLWSLDLETTGLDPKNAQILSVGMVPIREGTIRWGEHWYSLVRPETVDQATTDAIRVHEILPDELAEAPAVAAIVPEIAERIREAVLLVHWRSLDVAVLRREFASAGIGWPRPQVVDTADLLGRLDRRRRLIEPHAEPLPTQLKAAREALGLPPHLEHHALHDAMATAELFLALAARMNLTLLRQLR